MPKLVFLAPIVLAGSCAFAGDEGVYPAVAADAATTAVGAAAPGIGEANPLGWATVPLRIALVEHAKTLPRDEAQPLFDGVKAGGWGAATNNMLVLAGAGGAAPVVGVLVAFAVWKSGENERDFWRICAAWREAHPDRRCRWRD